MSTGFSINDVRDTLTADVTRFLGRIEASAREILERRDLGIEAVPQALPLFQAISDHGHAINGTSRLVEAASLSSSAHAVEQLATRGRDELAKAARHLERARQIAEALVGGASDMLEMLSLELEDRRGEAQKVAEGWCMRVDETLADMRSQISIVSVAGGAANHEAPAVLTSAPPPAAPAAAAPAAAAPTPAPTSEGWSFDEGWSEAAEAGAVPADDDGFSFASSVADLPVDVETGVIDAELARIFEEEARETLAALTAQLEAIAANPSDRATCRELERSYHSLKGAAATVGLIPISERAAALQDRAEALFEGADSASPEHIAGLIRDTEELRRIARLAPSSAAVVLPAPPVPESRPTGSVGLTDDVKAEFEREAQSLLDEAEHVIGQMAEAEPGELPPLTEQLVQKLHRLRGSALVVGITNVAREAERLEAACRAPGALDPSALTAGLARCAARVSEWPSRAPMTGGSSLDETRTVFLAEARAAHAEAVALLDRMTLPGDASGGAREELLRIAHRLKGTALVVGEDAIARRCTTLHAALETAAPDAGALREGFAQVAELLGPTPRSGDATSERRRIAVPAPDAELSASFQQECSELLENLDRGVLALETSERPKDQLQSLLGVYHTLKGAVNALALSPTGEVIHRVEDFLETLQGSPILPPMRGVVSLLVQVHAEIRRHLKTAAAGYVEVEPGRLEQRFQRLIAGESRATSAGSLRSGSHSSARLGEGSEASAVSGSMDGADRTTIRVPIDRLDALMNLAGELVINRSRLLSRIEMLQAQQVDLGRGSRRVIDVVEKFRDEHEFTSLARAARPGVRGQWGTFSDLELDRYEDVNILARSLAESSTDMQEVFGQLGSGMSALVDDSDALGAIIAGIQSEVTRARMIPLGTLFGRLQLPVRDAAQRAQREVRVATEGDGVHLDKTIVDALFQPMLHLVRNAVSHGLEPASRRIALGKPAVGVLGVRAHQELGQIVVEVYDDGGGLDLEKLRARGVAMGVIPQDTALDDPRVKDLVFVPGLTTEESAGAVAGRGVGCDVVRRAIERLNGSIRVDTVRGRGTSFIITLPLTLAISRALLVRHGGQTFAIPLYFTERIIDVQDNHVVESAGQRRVEIDDSLVAVRRMTEFVKLDAANDGPVLILRVGGQRLVVQVDSVVGQEELVVKGLGALLTGHPMFAGVTIRGTGDIVLIIDVPSLIESAAVGMYEPRGDARGPALRDELARAPVAPAPAPVVEDEGPLRVLFVDDSVSVRKVAERTLQGLGVSVTIAVDGLDALEKLHAAPFDSVFTDLEMPRMHGYELIRELRFLPAYSALPVVVVTSRSGKKHREEARALGATHYMTKPFSPQSLASALVKFGGTRARSLGDDRSDGPDSEGAR